MKSTILILIVVACYISTSFADILSERMFERSIKNIENEIADIEIQSIKARIEYAVKQCLNDDRGINGYCSEMTKFLGIKPSNEMQRHLKLNNLKYFIRHLVENKVKTINELL